MLREAAKYTHLKNCALFNGQAGQCRILCPVDGNQPHTIIIVDDEAIIREGLTDMVDWRRLGYEVTGCFADGRDAIEFLQEHDVDVILTDIKMDDVSGLEIARYAHEHQPDTQVVIISGHREFEYARDALRYRAAHYLLKPIDFDELHTVFADLKSSLTTAGHDSRAPEPSPRQFASDIISGRLITRSDVVRETAALGLGLDVDASPAALILVDFEALAERAQDPVVRNGVGNALRGACDVTLFEPGLTLNSRIVVLAMDSESVAPNTFAAVLCDRLNAATDGIRSAFQLRIVARVLACEAGVASLVDLSPASLVQKALSERPQLTLPAQTAEDNPAIGRVLAYVEKNFATDISLSDAASLAYLSPVYFGKVFRERMGVTFTEYLASVRMNKAIELLREQGHRVYEIGELVGYANPRYFARVFRKVTGYSPREYCTEILAREAPR